MSRAPAVVRLNAGPAVTVDAQAVLQALLAAVVVVDQADRIVLVNASAEQMLGASAAGLCGEALSDVLAADGAVVSLAGQARQQGGPLSEYGVVLESPRIGRTLVNVHASPLAEAAGHVAISLTPWSVADRIARQTSHQGSARSLSAMAALLAHEVKNPLSGIRGAAQLLAGEVAAPAEPLTRLIRDEVDRICRLLDRMEAFSNGPPQPSQPVNIHEVLNRVRQIAEPGFGRRVQFVERYDPSLPPVAGHFDLLIQAFLNLVKNACEAIDEAATEGGRVILGTAYRHGLKLAQPGREGRQHLPIMVTIEDNGAGIAEHIRPYLFDPFVSGKSNGTGLGLAMVAKAIGEHGGTVDCETQARRTVFRVMLAAADEAGAEPARASERPHQP